MSLDTRITAARGDLAAAHLRGAVTAERFVEPMARIVAVPIAPLTLQAEGEAELATQLLFGEIFDTYEEAGAWAWGQARGDGYVGYVPRACLEADGPVATHRVTALAAPVYPQAGFKHRPVGQLPRGALVAVAEAEGGYAALASGGFAAVQHLALLDRPAADWVSEAERLLGAPYLWGGRTPMGIDCSGLVQQALHGAGHPCPRDSDQQARALGRALDAGTPPRRGDLLFWRGHVGVMLDGSRLLHANIHHMAVAVEPLAEAVARIEGNGGGPVTRHARLDAPVPAR